MIVSTPYVLQARISYFLAMTVPASHAFLPFRNSLSSILHSRANIARRHQPNVGREFGRWLNPQFTRNSNNHPPKGETIVCLFSQCNAKFNFPRILINEQKINTFMHRLLMRVTNLHSLLLYVKMFPLKQSKFLINTLHMFYIHMYMLINTYMQCIIFIKVDLIYLRNISIYKKEKDRYVTLIDSRSIRKLLVLYLIASSFERVFNKLKIHSVALRDVVP